MTLTEATVAYADPGYRDDKARRHPIDTEAHVRESWSHINEARNQAGYSPDQVARIKARIISAGKRFGIRFNEADRVFTGAQIREAVAAITTEDELSSDESDLLLGRLISFEVSSTEVREAATGSDHTHSGPPRSVSDHLTSSSHGMSASNLPDGLPAMHNLHASLHGGDLAKTPVGYKPKESETVVVGDAIPLREKAVASDGVSTIKLIAPGWGSSGYYGESVLKRDIPKAFAPGTKMHWDHPTQQEERERPEGSLKTLAAEIVSVPRWQEGPDGPGMYADAKVFENFRKPVEELAPHIGVSIRAEGRGREGEVEGRTGRVVEQISHGHSVDFVTKPGAGGKVVQLFESYREGGTMSDQKTPEQLAAEQKAIDEKAAADKAAADKAAADKAAAEAATTTTQTTEAERTRRLEERLAMREAGDIVRSLLSVKGGVPEVTAKRLQESLPLRVELTADGELNREAFTKLAGEQIDAELRYISEATGAGRVRDMGSVTDADIKPEEAKEIRDGLRENLVALGSTKEQATFAIRD